MSIIFDALDKLEKAKETNTASVLDKQEEKNNKTANIFKSFLLHKDKKYLVYTILLIVSFFIVISGVSFLHKNNNTNNQGVSYSLKKAGFKSAKASFPLENNSNIIKMLGVDSRIINNAKLVLNGIAFSFGSRDNFALINNTVVKEGDKINGDIVNQITENWVELQTKDSKTYKLYSCYDKKK